MARHNATQRGRGLGGDKRKMQVGDKICMCGEKGSVHQVEVGITSIIVRQEMRGRGIAL
jgi:hypothetical protein